MSGRRPLFSAPGVTSPPCPRRARTEQATLRVVRRHTAGYQNTRSRKDLSRGPVDVAPHTFLALLISL